MLKTVLNTCVSPFKWHFHLCLLVLEARIQQLQTDIVLDVQHAKVQFVKPGSSGRGVSSGRSPKSTSVEKSDITKLGQTVVREASKSKPSRWMEKLTEEKNNKLKKQQRIQQKMQKKNVTEKSVVKCKGDKGSFMHPGTAHKSISTKLKTTVSSKKKNTRHIKLADEIRAAVSSTSTASGTTDLSHKVSRVTKKDSREKLLSEESQTETVTDVQSSTKEMAEGTMLEHSLEQQASHWTSSNKLEFSEEDGEETVSRDLQHSIRCYLEACVFAGDLERAHCFLLGQHKVRTRYKRMNTNTYNIMMRLWAKKVS